MGTTTRQKKDLEKRIQTEMPFFNGLTEEDKGAVIQIYRIKVENKEAEPDSAKAIEDVAKMYHAQKCAFQDVLTKEGFEICSAVPQTYDGRIAILTHHGTLIALGKQKDDGRHIVMARIHSPEQNRNNQKGYLTHPFKLRERTRFMTTAGKYDGSAARALAVNPHGADGDELQAAQSLSESVSEASLRYYKRLKG